MALNTKLAGSGCVEIAARISPEDQDALLKRLEDLEAAGTGRNKAQVIAAQDTLQALMDERKEFQRLLREQHTDLFADDLEGMFDDVLAEEISKDKAAGKKPLRTVRQSLTGAAKNTGEGLTNAIDALGELFGGKGKLGSGPTFDEETYAKAKPLFLQALKNFKDAAADLREAMRAIVRMVLDKFGAQATENMKPYVVRFIKDVQSGAVKLDSPATTTDGERVTLARSFLEVFEAGEGFKNILAARAKAGEVLGRKIEAGTADAKLVDEAVELAGVMYARSVIKAGGKATEIYEFLRQFQENQMPSLNVRDSVSLRNQAYSTPLPLAYVASKRAGVTFQKVVFEPTAGNGALLMRALPSNTITNEINPDRAEALRAQGFTPTEMDAATAEFEPKSADVVIMNPPFGPRGDERWQIDGLDTREIDHAIALNALKAMKDDGAAVLIIGGPIAREDGARKETYRSKGKREFFYNLYNSYNVVDHFTVSGDLYAKQGASFPVDVIVIKGRGKSNRGLPAAQLPELVDTWEALQEKLNEPKTELGTEGQGTAGGDTRGQGPAADQGSVRGTAVDAGGRDGGDLGGRGSAAGTGTPDGGRTAGAAAQPADGRAGNRDGQPGSAVGTAPAGNTGQPAAVPGGQQLQGRTGAAANQPAGVGAGTGRRADRARVSDEDAGKLQVKYNNFSGNRSVNTLVATNHLTAIERAFEALRARVGDIDQFVRNELQYSPEDFKKSFSAEQVEALALAIDNIQRGAGFIIGDQTGIGKGRVVAAMIRYARLNGKTPVFVTQMPDLYGDMMRDLKDIGMENVRPLMTNNNASVPLDAEALAWFSEKQAIETQITEVRDEMDAKAIQDLGSKLDGMTDAERKKEIADEVKRSTNPEIASLKEQVIELRASIPERRGNFLETPDIERHETALRQMVEQNSITGFDVIFTTYNQMAPLDSGKPRRDPVTGRKVQNPVKFGYRNDFLKHFVNSNTMLILDEAHNAGEAGDGRFPKLGDVVRQLIAASGGVFYSSATFAKNPRVMDAYSKTDLGNAFGNVTQLIENISSVPMQQITSAMLVNAGQYLRRERSFDGIEYRIDNVEVSKQDSEDVSEAMRLIVSFDRAKKGAIDAIKDELDAQGAALSDMGGMSQASVDSTNFTSVMHNVINTFLLALKAEQAANTAIAAIRAGEKPVITVANTLEAFISEYAQAEGLGIGSKIEASFADILTRYLEKTRTVRIKNGDGSQTVQYLTNEQLGEEGLDAYTEARDFIEGLKLSVPLSPIDRIKQLIEAAGYSIGEVTGRQTIVDENGVLRKRPKAEMNTAGKKNTIAKFNGGQIDALIINRSGSTGLSMHASETFADQRRRVMVIAQAELDINNHMQMLGRINRTGQVSTKGNAPADFAATWGLPRYVQMTADVPIELRPAAVLTNKMASLSANTTAGRKSAVEDKSAPDFMNKYGDRVASELVGTDANLNARLGYPVGVDQDGRPIVENAMARVTGRIGLLPLKEQSELYDQLNAAYIELLAQLEALGQNELEAKTYPLDAETLSTREIMPADEGQPSPFTAAVNAERVDVKKLGKPWPRAKVEELVRASLNGQDPRAIRRKMVDDLTKEIEAEKAANLQKAGTDADKIAIAERDNGILDRALTRYTTMLPPIGAPVKLETDNGNLYGIVTNVESKGKAKSAGSLSVWKIRIAVVDGSRSMTFSMTQLASTPEERALRLDGVQIGPATTMPVISQDGKGADQVPILDGFDRGQTDAREKRWMITGNVLRGYAQFKGRILNYTDKNGNVLQGIMLPPGFDLDAALRKIKSSLTDPKKIADLLDAGGVVVDKETGGDRVKLKRSGGAYVIEVSRSGVGKKIAKELGPYFSSVGNKMRATLWKDNEGDAFLAGVRDIMGTFNVPLVADENSESILRDQQRPNPQDFARTPDKVTHAYLKKNGRQVTGSLDAERAFAAGQRVFLLHESGGPPYEAQSVEDLAGYTPDQMLVVDQKRPPNPMDFARQPPQTPEWKRWFGKSKVVDANGKPLVVYHGTKQGRNFQIFRTPSHFGTVDQANLMADPLSIRFGAPANAQGDAGRVIPVYLRIENPIYVRDTGVQHDGYSLLDAIYEAGTLTFSERESILYDKNNDTRSEPEVQRKLIEKLEEYGYDGLIYDNKMEGEGASYAVFRPEQIKSVFNQQPTDNPSILRDAPRIQSPSLAFSETLDSVRADALPTLTSLEKKRDEGKITEAEYRLGVQQLIARMQQRNEERVYRQVINGRKRGTDWIIAKMRVGVSQGTVPKEAADFAQWLLDQNPQMGDGLGISIKGKGDPDAAGEYDYVRKVFTLVTGRMNTDTAVHEILHHAERMMPLEVQDGVLREWQRAWGAAYKNGTPELKQALNDMLKASLFGDKDANDRLRDSYSRGVWNYNDHYQLFSPSEFWAVNASRIMSGRYAAKGSWVKRAIQWMKEFIQRVKAVFGLRSDAPVIEGLNAVMEGNGTFLSQQMLMERDLATALAERETGETTGQTPTSVNDIPRNVTNGLMQHFGRNNKPKFKTFGLYHKTLSTQFNKALKDRNYGKVFAYANAMQNQVSLSSLRPSELAPNLLPRVDDIVSAARTMVKGRVDDEDTQGAANALFAGTLDGGSVLEGKVWSEEELRTRFDLGDRGVALYNEARAAIDASLDEMAAAEAYSMVQGFVPKDVRRQIIDNPRSAQVLILGHLRRMLDSLQAAIMKADELGAEDRKADLEASRDSYLETQRRVESVFNLGRALKAAGYAPLMRFGQFTVQVEVINPQTGQVVRDETGSPATLSFERFETQAEAREALAKAQQMYEGDPEVRVRYGTESELKHEMSAGISPETLALFAEAVGAKDVMRTYYQQAISERSALKRRLQRKGVPGYSKDMPRVLSNFITSNGRYAAQRYYLRDLTNAVKYIPAERGDVKDEAIKLQQFIMNPNDPAAPVSTVMFAWFLGGSVAAMVVNLSQPFMVTAPYLTKFGSVPQVSKLMGEAMPYAMGRKEINDANLKRALKRASQEGIVDAQEIFHLYSIGAQSVASKLVSALDRVPGARDRIKAGSESARARINAFLTLWGSMFSMAERFNRKVTFIAAYNLAEANGDANPYAFAVRAVNETQGIYNKVNRPNWGRGSVGRVLLTFKQYPIMIVELVNRMWRYGGPEGKRAALIMLAVLMLMSGEEGLPFAQDLDDIIDTIGQQIFGRDTNMKRWKREMAYDILGKSLGDLFLYGISAKLPLDFSGRFSLGNLIPGTAMFKKSSAESTGREIAEAAGPAGGLVTQAMDAFEAWSANNYGKAVENLSPKAVKDLISAAQMAKTGYAVDRAGRKVVDTTLGDAAIKAVGFNPTVVAEDTRKTMPVQQDVALQRNVEASIVDQWVRGIVQNDEAMIQAAQKRRDDWNAKNPRTPIVIGPQQIRSKVKNQRLEKKERLLRSTPKEMRGRVASELAEE
jgi:hypothetical protein